MTVLLRTALIACIACAGGAGIAATPDQPAFAAALAGQPDTTTAEKRRKPRVPGGSGCDSPRDVIEHPGCSR